MSAIQFFAYEQLRAAASELGWQVEMVAALVKKEVSDSPFFTSGGKKRQKILFERHVFWRHLVKNGIDPVELIRRDPTLRDILGSTPYTKYGKYAKQYERRNRAEGICKSSALAACSYTGFQILGENYAECGYDTVAAFVTATDDAENWLPAMVSLVKSKGVSETLQPHRLDFAAFAEKWNGPDYWRSGYDKKLGRIYQRELAAVLPKPESKMAAVVQSGTIQRGAAIVAMGAAPAAALLPESGNIADIIETVKAITAQGQEIKDQVGELQALAAQLQPIFDWIPLAASGWIILLLVVFGMLVARYLRDRGYEV
jgi:hypothetical protein